MLTEDGLDGAEDLMSDFIREAHDIASGIETLDGDPGSILREEIVHLGGFLEMAEACFLQIMLGGSISALGFAPDEGLRMERRKTQVEDQRFSRQTVDAIFEMFDPCLERGALRSGDSCGLMGEVGADIAVGHDRLAAVEGRFDLGFGFKTIPGIEKRSEMWIYALERPELAIEKAADHFPKPGVILRETGGANGIAASREGFSKQFHLRALAATVDSLDGDEFSAR